MTPKDFKAMDDKFAAAFKIARDEAGLSQEAVADRMREFGFDMSQPVIGKIERGMRRVTIGEAEALSSCLGTSISSLLAGPQHLRLERARSELRRLRDDLKAAAVNFQSGQMALAMFADESGVGSDEFSTGMIEHAVFESLSDVLEELKRDNIAANRGQAIRDDLDLEDGEEAMRGHRLAPDSYLGRYLDAFGDEVNVFAEGVGIAAVFGATFEHQAGEEGAEDDT